MSSSDFASIILFFLLSLLMCALTYMSLEDAFDEQQDMISKLTSFGFAIVCIVLLIYVLASSYVFILTIS